jgi:UDP-GlcNAc:undecaprenyl-phosphate GlcNAc-1-phosphate transferase
MGHSHFHAVLIFYGWTTVASVGTLLFLFFQDWWWPLMVTVVGLVVCTILTLAPLSRRKAAEAAVQSADPDVASDAALAVFDPLDAAAGRFADPANQPTDAQAERALERLQDKEKS